MLFLEFLNRGRTTYTLEDVKMPDRLLDEADISLEKMFSDMGKINETVMQCLLMFTLQIGCLDYQSICSKNEESLLQHLYEDQVMEQRELLL